MRKNYGAKPFSYPQPVFIIAAYDENGLPNAMNAADRKSTRLNSSHKTESRMPSSA